MHLHNCRCFQEHRWMLMQSLGALCKALGGPGSVWKVSGRFACGFQTNIHFGDVLSGPILTYGHRVFVYNRIPIEQEEPAKPRREGDMESDAWYWRRARSIVPPGCFPRLWWSASTLTQPFSPDCNVFCWCNKSSPPQCGPYLATSNMSPINNVNTQFIGQCSDKQRFTSTGSPTRQNANPHHVSRSSSERRQERSGGRQGASRSGIVQLLIEREACGGEMARKTHFK